MLARQRAQKRASYAAGGAQYMASVRSSCRRTIKTLGLDIEDWPRAKLLKDQLK
jgi:hypothetical protein